MLRTGLLTLTAITTFMASAVAGDSPAKRSADVVKVRTKAENPDASGKQVVTVTLAIDSPWHVYANPVGADDLKSGQTSITVAGSSKPEVVSIDYPKGKKVEDAVVGNYSVYENEVAIKVTIKRPRDAKGNVEFAVKLQACNDKSCLPPSTVKSTIE